MVRLQVDVTNEQAAAVLPVFEDIIEVLVKRMSGAKEPRSQRATLAHTVIAPMYIALKRHQEILHERPAKKPR